MIAVTAVRCKNRDKDRNRDRDWGRQRQRQRREMFVKIGTEMVSRVRYLHLYGDMLYCVC
jgi:hypothetical protein